MLFNRTNIRFIVVGLGNPGRRYAGTRHNVGFWLLDSLAERQGIRVSRNRFHALCGDGMVAGNRALLMKPMTFMNLSGNAVAEAMKFYKIPPEHVLVLCDDINLPPGVIRIRGQGSSGGHNGLKSLIDSLGTQDFPRIRIGVGGSSHTEIELVDWVTGVPSSRDHVLIMQRADDVCAAVGLIIKDQFDLAQSKYNG